MIERTLLNIFDCSAIDYLNATSDKNYPAYIVNHEGQVSEFKIIKSELTKDGFYQESIGRAKIYIPEFLRKIVGDKSFQFSEMAYTNYNLLKKRTILKSTLLDLIYGKMQTLYTITDLGNNKCEKETVTFFESGSRLLGSTIEKYAKERIDKQNQENDDRTKKWIKYWKENYRDSDHNCRSVGSI